MNILLDTNILIDAFRKTAGRHQQLAGLLEAKHRLWCCAITVSEFHSGLRPEHRASGEALLGDLGYVEVPHGAAVLAGRLRFEWARKGVSLSTPDALIAAVAIHEGMALATDNRRDFPMPELQFYPLPGRAQ